MEDLNVTTKVTTTEETEVTTPEVSDNAERNYDDFDDNSSGGNGLKTFAICSAVIGGLAAIGIAAYDKHKKKKEAEDKKKWNRDVNDIPKKEEEKEEVSVPDEVVDETDVPKDVKKK